MAVPGLRPQQHYPVEQSAGWYVVLVFIIRLLARLSTIVCIHRLGISDQLYRLATIKTTHDVVKKHGGGNIVGSPIAAYSAFSRHNGPNKPYGRGCVHLVLWGSLIGEAWEQAQC